MKQHDVVFNGKNQAGLPRARARFLAQAIELEESGSSGIISAAIYLSIALLVGAVTWAWWTEVSEVTTTRGEVSPAGLIHDIQHLEGGIVSEIRVREGDRVAQGDLLLRFAPTTSKAEYAQVLTRKAALSLEAERLAAIVGQREPDFEAVAPDHPALAAKQLTLYRAQLASHDSELKVADSQIRQRRTELTRQENQAKSIRKEINLLREQVEIREQMANKQLVARTELLSTQTRLAEARSEQRTISDSIIVAESALEEAQQRHAELEARFLEEIQVEAGEVAAQLAEVEQTLVGLSDRVARLEVHAPVSGIVQGLTITRMNAVVDPGQVIMQVVPIDDELIVEARISPEDIGHIHEGQTADVKIDSYDAARFGIIQGEVQRISPTTHLDEERNPYYRAEIALAQDHLGTDAAPLRIIPGMTVQADIKTGSKRLIDYLLRPISRGFGNAFHER